MAWKWKLVAMCVCLCLLGVGRSCAAEAAVPRYTYTESVMADLTISGGRATAKGSIVGDSMRSTRLVVQLQQYIDGGWRTIGRWTYSNPYGPSAVQGSEEVDQGFEYRAYAYGTVYDSNGTLIEAASVYSPSKYY